MNFLILITFLILSSANCEPTEQSSEINYVIAKPEPFLHQTPIPPSVNLVKYGPLSGHPIQALPYGANLAYKPVDKPAVLNYGHHRDFVSPPAIPLPFDYRHSNYPVLIDSNHHHPHLKSSPIFQIISGHPTGSNYHLIDHPRGPDYHHSTDHHRGYLNPFDYFVNPINHQSINPSFYSNEYSPVLNSLNHQHVTAPYPYHHHPTSFIKYSSPVSTSYFMKINHVVPVDNKYHAVAAKADVPFYDHHKLPVHHATSHYNYAPNFVNPNFINHSSIKK